MKSRIIAITLAPLLIAPLLIAAAPATNPAGPKVWEFSKAGIRGTAKEIRAQLYDEINQIKSDIANANDAIAASREAIVQRRAALAKRFAETNASYANTCKVLAERESELGSATQPGQIERLTKAVAGFTKAKETMEDREFAADKQFASLKTRVAGQEERLKTLTATLDKATAWRKTLAEATRVTCNLTWPLARGDIGTLSKVKITEISANIMTAEGTLFVPERTGETAEGITTIHGSSLPATFIIRGLDRGGLRVGDSVYIDQAMRVTSADLIGRTAIVSLTREYNDIDDLMNAVAEWLSK